MSLQRFVRYLAIALNLAVIASIAWSASQRAQAIGGIWETSEPAKVLGALLVFTINSLPAVAALIALVWVESSTARTRK